MACETPVVATAVGGIREVVIPEVTGILIEPRNPRQIADSVNRILKDRVLARKLGENGRKRVEMCYSWAAIAQRTKSIYKALA
jgi:glycosyltransferase involved in cell wall biosynthesis